MSEIDLNRFLNNFGPMKRPLNAKGVYNNNVSNQPQSPTAPATPETKQIIQQPTIKIVQINSQNLQMKNVDRAIYARDLFQMPRNINEFIYMVQRGMTQAQFNQMWANQYSTKKNILSQMQAQILAQLQDYKSAITTQTINNQFKNLEILSNSMINLKDLSLMFQTNGKEALTKVIMAMTEASKSGITDLSQMKEMAKLINASIAIASENNPPKTLKLLIMLYLPWLPLSEDVGFDLEISTQTGEEEDTDNILKITITTVNYGNVIATLIMETSNSVQVIIECNKDFPQKELKERISQDEKKYSMDAITSFIENKETSSISPKQASATINTSQATKINPYLLLMAHTLIKHVIDIDTTKRHSKL